MKTLLLSLVVVAFVYLEPGMKTVRGCADTCPVPGENEKVTCCATDKCNC
ncbi:toxin 3FTx-Dis4-like [Pantherophis guttatus]|uniref:Toxin 3FTx-Dis4-like n=1 Tax=Pantherophis guttatus TaxID=94885 RepID=A0ABM3YZS1_PANGU|nr:toxin 3FTx-Dis4-like [Pantherophis guttatus]